jgi:hypothetical protein
MEQEKESRPFPIRFGLPGGIKQLRVERIENSYKTVKLDKRMGLATLVPEDTMDIEQDDAHWRIWLMANGAFTLGTFIQLLDNGNVNRVTWHEDGTETVLEMKDDNDT